MFDALTGRKLTVTTPNSRHCPASRLFGLCLFSDQPPTPNISAALNLDSRQVAAEGSQMNKFVRSALVTALIAGFAGVVWAPDSAAAHPAAVDGTGGGTASNMPATIVTTKLEAAPQGEMHPAAGPNDVSAIPIRNGFSTKCLETNNDVGYNGAKVQQWSCVGQSAALWDFEFVGYYGFDFLYRIHHHDHPGKCLEIPDWSRDNGARAQLWDCVGQSSAVWREHIYGDTFTLINWNSNKCLEMPDWSTADGAIAQQWDCVGQSSAEWYHYA